MQFSPTLCHQYYLISYLTKKKKILLSCPLNHNIHNINDALQSQIVLNKFNVHFLILQVSVEVLHQKSRAIHHRWPGKVTLPALQSPPGVNMRLSFIFPILALKSVSKIHWKR